MKIARARTTTVLKALGVFLSVFGANASVAETCNTYDFAPLNHWTGEKSAFCTPGARVRSVYITQAHDGGGDWDYNGMGIKCCTVDTPPSTTDTCSEVWIKNYPPGKWENTIWQSCGTGNYVAGIRFFNDDLSSDYQSNAMAIRCCHPAVTRPEICTGQNTFADCHDKDWPGTRSAACDSPGGYIKEMMLSQDSWGSGDHESTGMGVTCCKPQCPTGVPFDATEITNASGDFSCKCNSEGASFDKTTWSCGCPTGYSIVNVGGSNKCRPNLPSAEYFQDANGYPVCGAGKVAIDASFTVNSTSNASVPKSSQVATVVDSGGTTLTYPYSSSTTVPTYIYGGYNRCTCSMSAYNLSPPAATGGAVLGTCAACTNSPTNSRFARDTYETINSVTSLTTTTEYGAIPITANPAVNGFLGASYVAGSCNCPNVNEKMSTIAPGNGEISGTICSTMLNLGDAQTNLAKVLIPYDSTSASLTAQHFSGDPNVSTVPIETEAGLFTTYNRKIWTCAAPFDPVSSSGAITCTFNQAHHACDNGAGGGPPSAVSDEISGSPYSTRFDNTINRKLACCLNAFHNDGSDPYEKFDCVSNSAVAYTSFDDLWSKSDAAADGGQINALMLSNSYKMVGAVKVPQMLTGFYSANGQHCDQFSEFAYPSGGVIKHYKVDPVQKTGQQTFVGAVPVTFGTDIPVPSSAAYGEIQAKVTGTLNKGVPTTPEDYRSCPILVRAAMVATCPPPTSGPNALTTVTPVGQTNPRCAVAGGIQIHIRIEQLFEITGSPPIKPVDTITELNSTTSIDVSKIISDKVGTQCPPFTHRSGEFCLY